MAETVIIGVVVEQSVSKLLTLIIKVLKETKHFKSKLNQLIITLTNSRPIFKEMQILNQELLRRKEETDIFMHQLEKAEELIEKCEYIKWNLIRRYSHSLKLNNLNKSLLWLFQIDIPLQGARDVKEALVRARDVQESIANIDGAWSSRAPLLERPVIGFEEQVKKLKGMVLEDSRGDDCSVIAVSGGPGSGKTSLVTMLCHDPEIQEKFLSKIYFATNPNTNNLKGVISNLLPMISAGQRAKFDSNEDAIIKWRSFLNANDNSQLLLVLDDVNSASIVSKFIGKSCGYKILITSQTTFKQFNTHELQPLDDEAAIKLLRYSSSKTDDDDEIPYEIVDELVKRCNKHPVSLIVVGGLLNGDHVDGWRRMLNKMSEGPRSILDLDLDETERSRIKTSLDFIEDQDHKIAACPS